MPNDPLKSVENIVQLPTSRRAVPGPTLHVPRTQPAPAVLFESWVATRDRAAAALLSGKKRLLLTGPAGTGKTVLVEHVARVLRAAGRTVIIQLADADPAPPEAGVTLFVDEADRLSATKLRQLLDEAAGAVVLTGLASLVHRVAGGTVKLRLDALDQEEAQDYIAQWLALNGRTPAELDGRAVRALVQLSGGVPRLLSTLLAAGSWLAKTSDSRIIEAVHIQEAAELRSALGPHSAPDAAAAAPVRRSRVMWSALLAIVVLGGTAAAIVPRLFPSETELAMGRATPFVEQAERWLRAEPSVPPPSSIQMATPVPVEPAPATESAATPEPAKLVAELPPPEPLPVSLPAAPEPLPIVPIMEIKPPDMAAQPAAPPLAAPSPTLPAEMIAFLLRRGREMLAIDDLSAARLLFLRAAEGGSPEAVLELGQTYDPAFRTSVGEPGQSDRAEALRWYRQAAAKGSPAAERLLPTP